MVYAYISKPYTVDIGISDWLASHIVFNQKIEGSTRHIDTKLDPFKLLKIVSKYWNNYTNELTIFLLISNKRLSWLFSVKILSIVDQLSEMDFSITK